MKKTKKNALKKSSLLKSKGIERNDYPIGVTLSRNNNNNGNEVMSIISDLTPDIKHTTKQSMLKKIMPKNIKKSLKLSKSKNNIVVEKDNEWINNNKPTIKIYDATNNHIIEDHDKKHDKLKKKSRSLSKKKNNLTKDNTNRPIIARNLDYKLNLSKRHCTKSFDIEDDDGNNMSYYVNTKNNDQCNPQDDNRIYSNHSHENLLTSSCHDNNEGKVIRICSKDYNEVNTYSPSKPIAELIGSPCSKNSMDDLEANIKQSNDNIIHNSNDNNLVVDRVVVATPSNDNEGKIIRIYNKDYEEVNSTSSKSIAELIGPLYSKNSMEDLEGGIKQNLKIRKNSSFSLHASIHNYNYLAGLVDTNDNSSIISNISTKMNELSQNMQKQINDVACIVKNNANDSVNNIKDALFEDNDEYATIFTDKNVKCCGIFDDWFYDEFNKETEEKNVRIKENYKIYDKSFDYDDD